MTGLRHDRGLVRLAICPADSAFPDCKEKAIRKASLAIVGGVAKVHFAGIPAGHYAIALFHDANSNGKLDTLMGIPREGYGFSRNPPFRPRAPRFAETEIAVEGRATTVIAMRYIL